MQTRIIVVGQYLGQGCRLLHFYIPLLWNIQRAGLALFCFGHSRRYKPDVGNQRERNVLGER